MTHNKSSLFFILMIAPSRVWRGIYTHYVREGVRLEADLFRLKQPFYLFCESTSNKSEKTRDSLSLTYWEVVNLITAPLF